MTKEEILDNNLLNNGGLRRRIFSAMDEYAKQQAIAFAVQYAKGALTWGYIKPEDVEHDRMEDRYNQFIEQQNKE